MSKTKVSEFVRKQLPRLLLIVAFVAIALYGVYGVSDRLFFAFHKQKILMDRRTQRSNALDVINDAKQPPYRKAEALASLAAVDEDKAIGFAREWVKFEDVTLVKASIHVLGLSRDKGDEKLLFDMYADLGKDKTPPAYRDDLLSALIAKPLSQESLYRIVEMAWTKKTERAKIYGAIVEKEQDPEQKAKILAHLKGLAKAAKGDEKSQAILSLSAAVPMDEEVLQLHRDVVDKAEPELLEYSALHLAKLRDAWYMKNYRKLLESKEPDARVAGVKSLAHLCPAGGLKDLEPVYFGTTDLTLKMLVLDVAIRYPGPASQAFLKKALDDEKLDGPGRQTLRNKVAQVQASNPKMCE